MQRVRRPGARPSALDLGRVLEYLDRRPLVAPLALLGLLAAMSAACALFAGQRRAAYTDAGHGGPAHRHGGPAHRQGGPAHRHGGPAHRHGGPAHRQGGPAHRWWRDGALAFSVASTGLIEMGVEFSVLLGFQVVCGYVYHYVGLLVASFMFGLALGAWVSSRWVRGGCATWRRMVVVQLCICAYPLALLGFLALSAGVRFAGMPAVAGVLFSLAALSAGFVGGLQFPLAVALHTAGAGSAGPLYGLDLFGSCLGALAVSSLLAPSLGLPGVCLMLAGLAGLGLLGLVASSSLSSSSSSSNL
ncbi:MAG: hypothetical protein FJ291_24500 [Planctomycetes bacterium]|nr:hypothetical protein [Planctomycetota bacterium]